MSDRCWLDSEHSRFTVQAFAGGALSYFAHSPAFAVRDFMGSVTLERGAVQGATLQLNVRADSLELTDDVRPADREEIQSRMRREVLETATYPEIRFDATATAAERAGEHEYQVRFTGSLTLHGRTRPHEAAAHLRLYSDGMRLTGESALRLSDFGIAPVTALGGTIKLKDQLRVAFDLVGWKETGGTRTP